ncbi:glutathione S-transferase family protein [Sphingomonas sp. IC-56]|uniref:glutathione S-transferase family protein n=1 Tax=Sphingomonas sp. IC-56 TaxID=2898529 RepID=UPI001E2ADFE0|nr:glutathione S-transferase family protein [Sphingomonas sp. IC-56]MCD2322819.1 glutathione S-transferase family protein [Sphingomonas sp. IC-56]
MPVDPNSDIEVTAFDWVPDFARGYVRDFRVRWALEEAGRTYRTRLISALKRPQDYFAEQPFGQVPAYRDAQVQLFESGAIVLHIASTCDALLPTDIGGRARATAWLVAALNSVEPMLMELVTVDVFAAGEDWARLRRPSLVQTIRTRLGHLADALGRRDFLEEQFTAGDLIMASALRALESTDLLAEHPNLAAYQRRCLERPGYGAAIAAQLADFRDDASIAA